MDKISAAVARLRAGDAVAAAKICEALLQAAPTNLQALTILAAARDAEGKHEESAELFRRLTAAQPEVALHWSNLGTALRSCGEYEAALDAYGQAEKLGFNRPDFFLNIALLHIDRLEFGKARAALQKAAAAAPRDAQIRYFQAVCSYEEVRHGEAETVLGDWRELEGLTPDRLVDIGALLIQLGETGEAEAALKRALALMPQYPPAQIRLAQVLERTNRVAEARSMLQQLRSTSELTEVRTELLSMEARLAERESDFRSAVAKYEALLAMEPPFHERYHVLFPLGRALDQLGEHERAMAVLKEAHDSQVHFLQKSAGRFVSLERPPFNIADYSVDAADVARWKPTEAQLSESPIFIVGFPRSGTTLLEQMLDAHPTLMSMDEQPFLQNAIDNIRSLGIQYPEALSLLTEDQCERLRSRYWHLCRAKAVLQQGQRLIDKNPLNMLRLPVIKRLFPEARIILAIRHPCDVLTSNYMQHYRAPEIATMCRSLESLALGYTRAFGFWYQQQAILGAEVLELRYESFVEDFEGWARRIAEFLGISWDEAMLRPAEQARRRGYISAPSYSQVVLPVNKRAVGRWRNYERHFSNALPLLRPWLERWGYED